MMPIRLTSIAGSDEALAAQSGVQAFEQAGINQALC
jgi:hypothetical protein